MTDDCGVETADGHPCQLPGSFPDNRCHHHTAHDGPEDAGRPTKLTRERQERIAAAIEDGSSINEASRKNDIHPETFRTWMEKGADQSEGVYAEFHGRLTRAFGEGEGMYRNAIIEIAVKNNDTATLMAMMKQRYPESWGDVDRGEQAGSGIQLFNEAPEDIDALVEALTEH